MLFLRPDFSKKQASASGGAQDERPNSRRKKRTTARHRAHRASLRPFTGCAAAVGADPTGPEEAAAAGSDPAGGADNRSPRHRAKSPVIRWEMSPIMPRPYWAAAPVMVRSV